MPAHPQPAVMTPEEFRALLDAAGLTEKRAAKVLGVHPSTVHRWQNGETPITIDRAALIRERIRPAGEQK